MSDPLYEFLAFDLPALLTGTLAVLVCGLLGNFLLLRRMSLMGDAISHSVLPGLVAGFLLVGSRETGPMFLGAAAAGVLTVFLVELLRKLAKLESGAAMGVVFSILFAGGILLIEQAAASGVDLDPDCVLNGQLEDVFWLPPREASEWSLALLAELPRELWTIAGVTALSAALIAVFFKELRLTAFDPGLAQALGVNPRRVNAGYMTLVAAAVVASFEAVGSILVIAMLVCPPAIARLLTDRLSTQVWISAAASVIVGVGGYTAAVFIPAWLGLQRSGPGASGLELAFSAAGMMTVFAGLLLGGTILFAPRYGLLSRSLARRRLAREVAREDLLAALYRLEETGQAPAPDRLAPATLARAMARGEIVEMEGGARLTERGRSTARELIRRHRLWESYLVDKVSIRPDHVHEVAERLEHLPDAELAERLRLEGSGPRDPHGRPIP